MLPLSEICPYYPKELHRFPRFMLREYPYIQDIGNFLRELSHKFYIMQE